MCGGQKTMKASEAPPTSFEVLSSLKLSTQSQVAASESPATAVPGDKQVCVASGDGAQVLVLTR